MLKLGVLALLEAKPGKESDVENFLMGGQAIVEQEPGTRVWYAFRVNGTSTFAWPPIRKFSTSDSLPGLASERRHFQLEHHIVLRAAGCIVSA